MGFLLITLTIAPALFAIALVLYAWTAATLHHEMRRR